MAVRTEEIGRSWITEKVFLGKPFGEYLRSLGTPFNALVAMILAVGIPVSAVRFWQGLGAVTNLSDTTPWGLWIGFDVLVGVALAAGGYTIGTAVYVFRLEEYRPIVRPAILTGFLGYFFVVVALLFDLGQPWRIVHPYFVSFGVTSVMFLVAWHVGLYLTCQLIEFSPAIFEWLGAKRLRRIAISLSVGVTIFGVMLSTLHQSALGALFLLAPHRVHPLWYSPLIPMFFFVSSIAAGLSIVIVESTISHRVFNGRAGHHNKGQLDKLTLGLGKAASLVLFTYFGLKLIGVMNEDLWGLLTTPMGQWFSLELIGFILLPSILFAWGAGKRNVKVVRATAGLTVLGIVLNRLNVSVIAFNWESAQRYVPSWGEIAVTITIITLLVITFRWIVNRMPVLQEHPDYPGGH